MGINGRCVTTNCDDNDDDVTTDSGRSLIVPSLHNNLKSRPFSTSYIHHTPRTKVVALVKSCVHTNSGLKSTKT